MYPQTNDERYTYRADGDEGPGVLGAATAAAHSVRDPTEKAPRPPLLAPLNQVRRLDH